MRLPFNDLVVAYDGDVPEGNNGSGGKHDGKGHHFRRRPG